MAQKVIKIGSSLGITLSKRVLDKLKLKPGDEIDLTYNSRKDLVELSKLETIARPDYSEAEFINKLYQKYEKQLEDLNK